MHYHKNYLSKVVLRFDFNPLSALQENIQVDVKPELSERIKDIFPHVTGQPTATISFNVGPKNAGVNQKVTGIQWFHRKVENGSCVAVLDSEFLTIEYGKDDYHHFPQFRKEVETVLTAFQALYQVPVFNRIGLRYINEIVLTEGNPLDWDGLIAPEIIAAVKAGIVEGKDMNMVRSMHQLHVLKNDSLMVFSYGLSNPDFPNALARRAFVLDYDCSQMGVVANDALHTVGELNSLCEDMFEKNIGGGLRELMGVINNG